MKRICRPPTEDAYKGKSREQLSRIALELTKFAAETGQTELLYRHLKVIFSSPTWR